MAPSRTILWLYTEFSIGSLDKQAVFKIHTSVADVCHDGLTAMTHGAKGACGHSVTEPQTEWCHPDTDS